MNFRQITPFMILMFFIVIMLQVGCDTLVTENNTTIFFDSTLGKSCIESCHTDDNNILLRPKGQFDNSAHADFSRLDILFDKDGNPCGTACHTHEGHLANVDLIASTSPGKSAINCYTCHLPHSGNYGEWNIDTLRASDNPVTLVSGFGATLGEAEFSPSNACTHCHSASQAVNTISNVSDVVVLDEDFGPHVSPQTDILSGRNGYFVDNAAPQPNTHILNGCIKCHYGVTGEGQGYTYAEHTFRLEDRNSLQQYNNTCGNDDNACHLATEITDFYDRPSIANIDTLSTKVKALLASFEIIDSADTSGLTYSIGDSIPSIYAEAYYNYLLYKHDRSRGIHNAGFVNTLLSTTINVLDSLPPMISFTIDDSLGCFGQDVTFTPSLVGGFDTLHWSFGDNSFETTTADTPITKTYSDSGIYDVKLNVVSLWTNSASELVSTEDSLLEPDFVTIDTFPFVDFESNDSTICFGDTVFFTNKSTHLATGIHTWNFGYGEPFVDTINFGEDADMVKIFDTIGTFDISLNVSTSCGDTTVTKPSFITVEGAMPIIDTTYVDSIYTFTSNSLGAIDSIAWDYDNDGIVDSTTTPIVVTYQPNGTLIAVWVKLTVFTSVANCEARADSILILVQP